MTWHHRVVLLLAVLPTALAGQRSTSIHGTCVGGFAVADFGARPVLCPACTIDSSGRLRFGGELTVQRAGPGRAESDPFEDGDAIVAIAGVLITSPAAVDRLQRLTPGDTVEITIRRDGVTRTVRFATGTRCVESIDRPGLPFRLAGGITPRITPAPQPRRETAGTFGLTFWCVGRCAEPGPGGRLWEFHEPPRVAAVTPGSAAAAMGFREGDRVLQVDGHDVMSAEGTARFLQLGQRPGARVGIERDGRAVELRRTDA